MSDRPTCPRCAKPIHTQANICDGCSRRLQVLMLATARLDPWTTIARLDVITAGGTGTPDLDGWERNANALEPIELPLRPEAAAKWRAAVGELTTRSRHVAETRGINGPATPAAALTWLAINLGWLMHRDEAWEAYQAIDDACKAIRRIVDTRPGEHVVGWCGTCNLRLYADRQAATAHCAGCSTDYDAKQARAQLIEDGRDQWVTAADAADILVGWDESRVVRDRLRKLIHAWATRGLISVADWIGETPRYRLGDVIDKWTDSLAARVA